MTVACSTLFSSAVSVDLYLRIIFEGTSLVRRIEGFASTVIIMNLLTMKALLIKEKVYVCLNQASNKQKRKFFLIDYCHRIRIMISFDYV